MKFIVILTLHQHNWWTIGTKGVQITERLLWPIHYNAYFEGIAVYVLYYLATRCMLFFIVSFESPESLLCI